MSIKTRTRSKSKRSRTKLGKKSMIQSIIFNKNKYTVTQARAWLKRNGYKVRERYIQHQIFIGSAK